MTKRPNARYWTALVMDLAFAAAGIISLYFPSKAVAASLPGWAAYIWGTFYIVGGLVCAYGVVTRRLGARLIGLPLMVASSALYGTAALLQYHYLNDGAYLFVGVLLWAQAMGLVDRLLNVSHALRIFERQDRRRE